MTLEEYDARLSALYEEFNSLDGENREWKLEEINGFKLRGMNEFLKELSKETGDIEDAAYHTVSYLIRYSSSGSVVSYMSTEARANELADYLNEHKLIGKMLLDSPQIYPLCNGKWAVDCMFGGFYCPYWDGE